MIGSLKSIFFMSIAKKISNYFLYLKGVILFRKRELLLKKQLYKADSKIDIIVIFNGKIPQGGLADRLKCILCVYAYAKKHSLSFGISHFHPFDLSYYLNPKTDWVVNPRDINYDPLVARPYLIPAISFTLFKLKLRKSKLEKHIYSSGYFPVIFKRYGYTIGGLFNELFSPSEKIKNTISFYKSEKKYWSAMHFRFLNLLGDFKEREFNRTLSNDESNKLVNTCLNFITRMQRVHPNIYISSDSQKFILEACKLDGVFTVEGNIIHVDNSNLIDNDFYLKTFLDFFLIANATKVYSIVGREMYASYFPVLACQLNNIPFERIQL